MKSIRFTNLRRRGEPEPRPAGGWRVWLRILLTGFCLACAGKTLAQEFTLEAGAVTSGGLSSGGDFSVEALIGAADAGVLGGGDFEVSGGFWSVLTALEIPGAPLLSLSVSGRQVVLSWPAAAGSGFKLEEATALAAAPATTTWTVVSATNQPSGDSLTVTLPLASGNHFFRLHQSPSSP